MGVPGPVARGASVGAGVGAGVTGEKYATCNQTYTICGRRHGTEGAGKVAERRKSENKVFLSIMRLRN